MGSSSRTRIVSLWVVQERRQFDALGRDWPDISGQHGGQADDGISLKEYDRFQCAGSGSAIAHLRETQNLRHLSEDRKCSDTHALVRIPDDRCWHPLSRDRGRRMTAQGQSAVGLADPTEGPLRVEPCRSISVPRPAGIVKGFRMPASHCARGCTEAGVRKASKEETAGGVCAGGGVGLWGFKARF